MRKISIISIIIALAFVMTANGQMGMRVVQFGVKGGVNTQSVDYVKSGKHTVYNLESKAKAGYHLGIVSRINLPMFHIQPEMIYTHTSHDLTAVGNNTRSKSKVKVNTLEMPVLAGLRLFWFRLQAGPQFTLMTETKFSNGGSVNDVDVSKSTMSFLLGLGFDVGKMNFDVRYNGQFSRPKHSVQFLNETTGLDYRSKMRKWMFSFAYVF